MIINKKDDLLSPGTLVTPIVEAHASIYGDVGIILGLRPPRGSASLKYRVYEVLMRGRIKRFYHWTLLPLVRSRPAPGKV